MSTSILADTFRRVMLSWFEDEPEKLVEMDRLNRDEYGPNVCASHDFCDANMAMVEAFEQRNLPKPYDFEEKTEAEQEASCLIWNEAWEIAKTRGFSTPITTTED